MGKIDKSQNWVLRSTNQQTQTGLLWVPPGYRTNINDALQRTGIQLSSFMLHNRAAASITVGIGGRLRNGVWVAGQWDDSETTAYTADTANAQETTADDFALETTTNNDGLVIASLLPFGWASINVTTAGVDGAATTDRAVRYSNTAGSGWTALGTGQAYVDNFTSTNTVWAAGENIFVWKPPADWGPVQAGGLAGVPAGYYALNVRTTDAPDTTAALAGTIEIGLMPFIQEAVADNNYFSGTDIQDDGWLERCDAVVALFSTTNAGNSITGEAEPR